MVVFHVSTFILQIQKGVVFIISPSFKRLYRRSSCLRYNQYKHCGFVSIVLTSLSFGEIFIVPASPKKNSFGLLPKE